MDLREQLKAAMSGEVNAPEPNEAITPAEGAEAAAPPVSEAPESQTEAKAPETDTKALERDESGRFKAKNTEAQAGAETATPEPPKEPESAKPEEKGPQTEATRIPPSLPAAVKAQWADLKPEVQQAFSKLEETVQTAKAEWGKKGERLNRYDEIVGPHLDRWRMAGLDEFAGVQTLIAAQNILERNPVDGLVHIARSYGVHPQQLAQAFGLTQANGAQPGAEGQPAPTAAPDLTPVLQPVLQQVQTLQQQLQQLRQGSEHEKLTQAQAEVTAFANDPANLYFENVRPVVAKLLETGQASTLKDAYEQAIWASPEIRPLLLAAQTAEAARAAQAETTRKAQEQEQRAKAQAAAKAAGSVTGAPAPGATAPGPGSTGNLREDLLAAKRLSESRA
jgi:hypothetical protein